MLSYGRHFTIFEERYSIVPPLAIVDAVRALLDRRRRLLDRAAGRAELLDQLLDALTGVVFHDDSQVERLLVTKSEGERPRICVTARPMKDVTVLEDA